MTIKELVSKIALQEGKKHQATVGDVREITKLIFTELAQMKVSEVGSLLKGYTKAKVKKS